MNNSVTKNNIMRRQNKTQKCFNFVRIGCANKNSCNNVQTNSSDVQSGDSSIPSDCASGCTGDASGEGFIRGYLRERRQEHKQRYHQKCYLSLRPQLRKCHYWRPNL